MIYVYAVKRSDSSPMYGRDRVLFRSRDKKAALERAWSLTDRGEKYLYVEEREYFDEDNLLRDFAFDSSYIWTSWNDHRTKL